MTVEKRLAALHAAITESAEIIDAVLRERDALLNENTDLRLRLVQALERLQISRAHAMVLAEKLEKKGP